MNRRSFLQLAGATCASVMNSRTVLSQGSGRSASRKALMKVGH